MMRRAAIFAFVLYQAFWLNAVVPGHTRGLITIGCASCDSPVAQAGGEGAGASCHVAKPKSRCCPRERAAAATAAAAAEKQRDKDSEKKPTSGDRARCAVCFFAAGLTVAPPIDPELERGGLVAVLDVPAPQSPVVEGHRVVYLGRAPPVA
ncbi:MAG TPA: hypothetical protein VEA69_23220 [Tepidisphaeraceae bacterium]|nr:hypothetical protein [Tepidisphaeraceae bacterium]